MAQIITIPTMYVPTTTIATPASAAKTQTPKRRPSSRARSGNALFVPPRMATWDRVGHDVEDCKDVNAVLAKAHLDYVVEKRQSFFIAENPTPHYVADPGRFKTVRVTDDYSYGDVSGEYEIIQNEEAFDFVNYMHDDIEFVKAGETAGGMVYIIGKLPPVNILGDTFVPYVIFQNGFNGRWTVKTALCPLRIVCQNQFNVSFKETSNTINIRHSSNATEKLKEAAGIMKRNADYMAQLNRMAEGYAAMKVTPRKINRVMDAMFPINPGATEKQVQRLMKKKEEFVERFKAAYKAPDNANFKGTAWALVNAYTDILTHEPLTKRKNAEEGAFAKVTFGNDLNKFLDVVKKVAA